MNANLGDQFAAAGVGEAVRDHNYQGGIIDINYQRRGYLPQYDPLNQFPCDSELSRLDDIGRDLPSLLMDHGFRQYVRELQIPPWPEKSLNVTDLSALRLYYVRLGFIASAYVNQVGAETVNSLPRNIAIPLCAVCRLLGRPPILSYDGYALYNWKRYDVDKPIALGNIDTIQNFVHLYDEHWFIVIHVEIEAIASRILDGIARAGDALVSKDEEILNQSLRTIAEALQDQIRVLRRIPEHMDPALYYKTFRPYIRFFEHIVYEGVERLPINYRGETGAQSSIIPTVVAFMKIPHESSTLTEHLADMRNYMPPEHRCLVERIAAFPDLREMAGRDAFNAVLDNLSEFRQVHHGWAEEYISKHTDDPRGTGGTPYMHWLTQLIDETRNHRL